LLEAANVEDLESDEIAVFVDVDVHVWRNLFGFHDRPAVRSKAGVEGVGVLIVCGLHGFPAPRSKKGCRDKYVGAV